MDESGAPKDGDRASSDAGARRDVEAGSSPVRKISWILVTAAVLFAAAYFFGGLRSTETDGVEETASGTLAPREDAEATPLDTLITPADLPGFETQDLTNAQRLWLYHRAHREMCACDCGMTVAQCRVEDPTCPESPGRSVELVQEAKQAVPSGG